MSAVVVLGGCSGAPTLTPDSITAPTAAATTASANTAAATAAPASPEHPTTTLAPGVTRVIDLSYRPSGIVAAGDVLWAEDHAATRRVYAIDPETGQTRATIDLTRPCDVIAAYDRIWVADVDAGRLLWIDPATFDIGGEVTGGLRRPCGVQAVDGALWLAVDDGLARVDPITGETTITELSDAAFPGAGMPLWAALFGSGDLVLVDTASGAIELTVPHPGGRTEGPPVAVGFEALWVGGPSDQLYRLNPQTGTVEAEIPATAPTRLLVTADAVWLTSYLKGVVERIDPTSDEVVFRARLGGNINGITEGFGGIWVTDTSRGLLYRIDPIASGIGS